MRSCFYLFSFFIVFHLHGQELTISEPLKLGALERDIEIIGTQGDHILVSASSSSYERKTFIIKYASENLKLVSQSELKLKYKKPQVEKIYTRNDTVYAFYSAYVENKLSLILSTYKKDFSKPFFSKIIAPLSKRKFVSDDFLLLFEHSNDWSHIVILKSRVVNGQSIVSEYFVLKDFKTLVNGGLTQSNYNLLPAHFLVNNIGEFFLIYSESSSGFLDNRDLHSSFLVEHYYKDAMRPREIPINYDKRKIAANYFKIDDLNNMLVGSGFYTGKKSRFLEGYFMYRYNYLRSAQEALHFRSFSEGRSEKLRRIISNVFKGKVPNNFIVHDLILRRDGGLVLCGESFRISENISSRNMDLVGVPSEQYTYYNREVLVLNVSPTATLDWVELISKNQISRGDEIDQSSYFLMNATESLNYIYNETIGRNANLRTSNISYEGQKESNNILNSKEKSLIALPRKAFQINRGEVVVPAMSYTGSFFKSRNSISLIKLSF